MPIRGHLLKLGAADFDEGDLTAQVGVFDQAAASPAVVNDLIFGVTAPNPVVIPYGWLSPPATFRADQPINSPQVSQAGGGTAVWPNASSIAVYGEYPGSPTTLSTLSPADPVALAYWFSTYFSGFRMRCPSLTINLLDARRTQEEIWRVLGVRIGDRISVPDAPTTWPEGTNTLFVEGISHTVSQNQRLVTFNTSPVVGASPSAVGPWFREGISVAGGSDAGPF